MFKNRLKQLRQENLLTLDELGKLVNKSATTLSRYENEQMTTWDPELVEKIANVLEVSPAYLTGITDDYSFDLNADIRLYGPTDEYESILVTDEDMDPLIPYGALVQIRPLRLDEEFQLGAHYYIEFDGQKKFRMAHDHPVNGLGFLPNDSSERRISYDPAYVTILGKAVSMKVVFEDQMRDV